MKILTSLVFLLFATLSFAEVKPVGMPNLRQPLIASSSQKFLQNKFQVSAYWTTDSTIIFSSQLKPSTRWVWFQISKGAQKDDAMVPATAGTFSFKAWLRFGPGKYKVKIFTTESAEQYTTYLQAGVFELENTDTRENLNYLAPSTQIQADHAEIVKLAAAITSGLTSELEKTRAIHDWVASNISYDVEGLLSGRYQTDKHDAVTILNKRLAVCEGYSNLTAALNRALGIPTKKVVGEGIRSGERWTGVSNHAWNESLVEGRWLIQDTTWDAGYMNMGDKSFVFRLSHKYFDPDPAMFAKDHRKEKEN